MTLTTQEIERMLADATPGPWHHSETWRPPIGNGPHEVNCNGNIFWGYSISGSNKHGGHIYPTLAAVHNFPDNIKANARFIASAPDLARLAIDQARELAAVNARIDRMNVAIEILEDALQEAGDDYPGSSMQSWCQQQVKKARAALKEQPE